MARLKVTNSSSTMNISFQNEPMDFLLNSQRVTVFDSSVLNNIGCTKPPPFHMAGLEIVGPKKAIWLSRRSQGILVLQIQFMIDILPPNCTCSVLRHCSWVLSYCLSWSYAVWSSLKGSGMDSEESSINTICSAGGIASRNQERRNSRNSVEFSFSLSIIDSLLVEKDIRKDSIYFWWSMGKCCAYTQRISICTWLFIFIWTDSSRRVTSFFLVSHALTLSGLFMNTYLLNQCRLERYLLTQRTILQKCLIIYTQLLVKSLDTEYLLHLCWWKFTRGKIPSRKSMRKRLWNATSISTLFWGSWGSYLSLSIPTKISVRYLPPR